MTKVAAVRYIFLADEDYQAESESSVQEEYDENYPGSNSEEEEGDGQNMSE